MCCGQTANAYDEDVSNIKQHGFFEIHDTLTLAIEGYAQKEKA